MSRVTLAPDLLFLSTWDAPERIYMSGLLKQLRENGYTRYREPSVGAFAMATVAVEAGWKPEQIEASDVHLFSAVLGYYLSDQPLDQLEVKLDGALVDLAGPPEAQAAAILWTQLLARLEKRAHMAPYWEEVALDLLIRRRDHMASIVKGLLRMRERLHGISFKFADPRTELHGEAGTVVVSNPPTYKGAYERFFDTGGRLTWEGPRYAPWDPDVDQYRAAAELEGQGALAVIQQQTEPRTCAGRSVYARHLSPGQYVYLWSNRDEILALTGGPVVKPRSPGEISRYDAPDLEDDHLFTADSEVGVVPVPLSVAAWYRQRWLHRLVGADGAYNFLVLVDGHVAGVGGYSFKAIQTPYPGVDAKVWAGATILRFALGAPHQHHRVTRLITRIALQRETLTIVAKAMPSVTLMAAGSDKFITTEYTRHPEAKGLRGMMKLADRRKDGRDGYRLVYWSPMGALTAAESYELWRVAEAKRLEGSRDATTA